MLQQAISIAGFIVDACGFHLARLWLRYLVIFLALILFLGYVLFVPPRSFTGGATFFVAEGASTAPVAEILQDMGLVSSGKLFHALARISGTDRHLQSGTYVFARPLGVVPLLYRFANGITGVESIRITIPEGSSNREIADIVSRAVPGIQRDVFIVTAKSYEGYLFPDTYEFFPTTTAEEIVERMRARFTEVIEKTLEPSDYETHTLDEIVTMASLLEKETKADGSRPIVSGILWNRIKNSMPLQVDAVFGYIKEQDTYHPSLDDLEINSPYNTYRVQGLPPTPINNPGKDALLAAARPEKTIYLYYLSGNDGVMRYGKTFEEHKQNRARFLDTN